MATSADEPLCGDPTCQSYACTQAAIDDYMAYQYEEARKIVRDLSADHRPYVGGQPGRLDVNGVEWWACDPYPTWYRWEDDGTLTQRSGYGIEPAAWADESDG